jgi:hypothetical protein
MANSGSILPFSTDFSAADQKPACGQLINCWALFFSIETTISLTVELAHFLAKRETNQLNFVPTAKTKICTNRYIGTVNLNWFS